jgi:indolepyruvate ferredoxin oxidoreductase
VSTSDDTITKIRKNHTHAIINTHESVTGPFTQDPDYDFPLELMKENITKAAGKNKVEFLDATHMAEVLLGDSIMTNLFMIGYGVQRGVIPLSSAAIEKAIELNKVSIPLNIKAFNWGRLAAHNLEFVKQQIAKEATVDPDHITSESLDEKIQRRYKFLEKYQDKAYAERYKSMLLNVKKAEQKVKGSGLAEIVAQSYFRLLAIKDEYEVARLYTDGNFEHRLKEQFEGDYKLQFHLAPPLLSKRDKHTGHLIKRAYGAWIFKAFKILSKFKGLRGTKFDIFSYLPERKAERKLLANFEAMLSNKILPNLSQQNIELACEIVRLSQDIRGFGHVKEANMRQTLIKQSELLEQYLSKDNTKDIA